MTDGSRHQVCELCGYDLGVVDGATDDAPVLAVPFTELRLAPRTVAECDRVADGILGALRAIDALHGATDPLPARPALAAAVRVAFGVEAAA